MQNAFKKPPHSALHTLSQNVLAHRRKKKKKTWTRISHGICERSFLIEQPKNLFTMLLFAHQTNKTGPGADAIAHCRLVLFNWLKRFCRRIFIVRTHLREKMGGKTGDYHLLRSDNKHVSFWNAPYDLTFYILPWARQYHLKYLILCMNVTLQNKRMNECQPFTWMNPKTVEWF